MSFARGAARSEDVASSRNDVDESYWSSPVKEAPMEASKTSLVRGAAQSSQDSMTTREAREARLRQELASVRNVNEAIESVLGNLERAKSNMKSVNQTVHSASSLLNIWTRILSQTEHNQRLILDPTWQGASQDIADIEEEALAKQQAADRRALEEQERKAAATKKAEEEDRSRAESVISKPKPTVRHRAAPGRGTSASRTGYVGSATNNSASGISRNASTNTRRTMSGPNRGARGTRGRG